MALTLHYHPLSSFCWKALVGLYESGVPFSPLLVNLGEEASRAAFLKVWPMGQFPVLQNGEEVVPQSSVILEYLALKFPAARTLYPVDAECCLEGRKWDACFDDFLHVPMQKIVGDCLREKKDRDAVGVAEARETIRKGYGVLEAHFLRCKAWCLGEDFTAADCSACPALFYADKVEPLGEEHPSLRAYLARLKAHPSFAKVLEEAAPYFKYFPYPPK